LLNSDCVCRASTLRRRLLLPLLPLLLSLLCLLGTASDTVAQALKTAAGKAGLALQTRMAVGGFQPVDEALTPCVASWKVLPRRERRFGTPWIGRFVVEKLAPGAWSLVVMSLDGDRPDWRAPITTIHAGGAAPLQTDVFPSGNVAITLEVATPMPGPCPVVILTQELRVSKPAERRGRFGANDDRWEETNPKLTALANAAVVKGWAGAVVRLDVVTPTGLMVPCTGYFITANLLMTAAHCVSTDDGARQAVVHLGTQRLSGSHVRLVMSQGADGDLDFSLLFVDVTSPKTLALKDSSVKPLAIWQAGQDKKKVSNFECLSTAVAGDDIEHTCDTIGGSSGSPVQDLATGDVVGLHVAGCTSSDGTTGCRNGAKRSGSIRGRLLFFANALKSDDPPAAAQLVAAGLLPP
jgi:hypothetical protein